MGVLQIVVKGPPFIPDPTGDYGCADAPNCDDMHGCNVTNCSAKVLPLPRSATSLR